ncbi:flagellar hook-associated protein FlgK [Aneurinibacillus tyrosinisolvens]|uniref:flagellar hook-associated protein FlgK n=1 Tax=Aneurinibacillus tyrosinisolvens TaxID=1443435 RepID=UPI00063EECC1|nr:flagellar hook-associated protein FlgK [Aneurinibacillus tyrosinisolvens]
MPSTFSGLEIGKRGIFAQQSALYTTGHNIANANTEGFTRQRVNLQASSPIPYPSLTNDKSPGQLGTGVTVQSLERLREDFLDLQFRGENKNLGEWEAKTDTLEKIEVIMNEPSDTGLQNTLDKFWQSWQDLTLHPENLSTREVVRQRGIAVADTFDFMSRSLTQLSKDVDTIVGVKTSEMNSMAKQIADLNKQIGEIVPHGYTPNDLYDQRDLLIDKLSKMADVTVSPSAEGKGMVDVFVNSVTVDANGTATKTAIPLVAATVGADVVSAAQNGKPQITIGGTPVAFDSGEMAGLVASRDVIIPSYLNRMNTLSTHIAEKINEVHRSGIDLDMVQQYRDTLKNGGDVNALPKKGDIPFFVSKKNPANPPEDASDMQVNPAIIDSLSKIAAGKEYNWKGKDGNAPSFEGDGSNASEIGKLKFTKIQFLGTSEASNFDDFTRYTISKLGIETQEAQRLKGNAEVLTGQVENRRQSVSGVSLDEEMSNMIKFQHAYSASARMITATDEMLDKVINGMGLVGR